MLIKQGKTNIKYLLVVVVLATVVGGGVWWLLMIQVANQGIEPNNNLPVEVETAEQIVEEFCAAKNPSYSPSEALYIQADTDSEKEVLGLCWRNTDFTPEGILFLLDSKDNNLLMEEIKPQGNKPTVFQNLKIRDIDNDNVEEITFKSDVGGAWGCYEDINFYSPKFKDWFYVSRWADWDKGYGFESCNTNVLYEYSDNLADEEYKIFYEFLEQEIGGIR